MGNTPFLVPKFTLLKFKIPPFLYCLVLMSLMGCSSLSLATKHNPDKIDEYLFTSKIHKARYHAAYAKTLKLFKVPVEEKDIETQFGSAHVLISGPKNAPPILLIHGMDASSTMWYPNMRELSKNHRVYAVDYIMDAGKSVLKKEPLTNEDIPIFYNEVLDAFKVQQIDVIGTSRGGWIATWLALQPENRVRKLVLMSPAQALAMVDMKIFPAILFKVFPSRGQLKKTLRAFAVHPEKIAQPYKEQFYIASKYGKSRAMVTQMMPFEAHELKKINCPVLLLVGDHDIMNGEKAVANAKENIQNLTFETIKDAGHFMSTDQSEKVNATVLKFLAAK